MVKINFIKLISFPCALTSFYFVGAQNKNDSITTKEIKEVLIKLQRKKQFSVN